MGDINPNIWILWARFKEHPYLDTIGGIHHRDGDPKNPKPSDTHYVVLRRNLKVIGPQAEEQHFRHLAHEMGHVMGRKHEERDGNDRPWSGARSGMGRARMG